MRDDAEPPPIVIALAIDDAALTERLASLLADVPGLRLARGGERADARIVGTGEPAPSVDLELPLTPRETEVLALLAAGASNKAIARALGISVHTAKFHVGQVLDKFDATGRTDAVAQAARLGVLNL